MHVIFAYGTLRHGQGNHGLLAAAQACGAAQTRVGYHLYYLGAYPGMVHEADGYVVGELYAVDDDTLARIDALEEHPDYYRRQRIHLDDGREVWAWLLPMDDVGAAPRIPSGDWLDAPESHAVGTSSPQA